MAHLMPRYCPKCGKPMGLLLNDILCDECNAHETVLGKCRSREIFKFTLWKKIGDHPDIVQIEGKYKDFVPVTEGAMGYYDHPNDSGGTFVSPGDYIIELDEFLDILSPDKFHEKMEIIQ